MRRLKLRQPNSEYDQLQKVPLSNCQELHSSHIRRGGEHGLHYGKTRVRITEMLHESESRARIGLSLGLNN